MIKNTKLKFEVLDTKDCSTIAIVDTSIYNSIQKNDGLIFQIITPFDPSPIELNFYRNSITFLNSNLLGITSTSNYESLQDLPDGLYTGKISMCPYDKFFYEKSWFRTCQLECIYKKAVLKLNISSCESCFSKEKLDRLQRAFIYIEGAKFNAEKSNLKEANKLYSAAEKILKNISDCEC